MMTMTDSNDLYQEVILDHYRKPRNSGTLPGANRSAVGHNPLCGDKLTVALQVEGENLREVRFQGIGCAISTASASLMTEWVRGKSRSEIEEMFQLFHDTVTSSGGSHPDPRLGKLAALTGVREYPMRVKCATLAWHTLRAALSGSQDSVTTE